MGKLFSRLFPPSPAFTERIVPPLVGKVFVVTGGNLGVRFELVKILYAKGGSVYIAGRSTDLVAAAIDQIKSKPSTPIGQVKGLHLDLADLTTIPAGQPYGTVSKQGHEIHTATNCLSHFLLTNLLLPILLQIVKLSPVASVRVVYTSSGIMDLAAPPGGLSLAELVPGNVSKDVHRNYAASKAGNWFLAAELDKRTPPRLMMLLFKPIIHEPKMGVYTGLWAGLSPGVSLEDGGKNGLPWGRWDVDPKKDILESMRTKEEGGTGLAADFWDWCHQNTKAFS
ncbi:hypothetical protein VTL71DRAFT_13554 [Oculimacula yallundae]|uniref:Uncharacterized protein n=1 Tax=Oculimacula yallundae TaxID=86028 RepID=A0ABR4CKT6_9HELO